MQIHRGRLQPVSQHSRTCRARACQSVSRKFAPANYRTHLSVDVTVLDATGAVLAAQVNPVFLPGSLKEDKSSYEVSNLHSSDTVLAENKLVREQVVFLATIEPLSPAEFVISGEQSATTVVAKTRQYVSA